MSVPRDAVVRVLAGCQEHCARAGPAAAPLLNLLLDLRRTDEQDQALRALAADWGRAMASQVPSEDQLFWLGGVWLSTVHRLFGAESEVADALGQLFAIAAEQALAQVNPPNEHVGGFVS